MSLHRLRFPGASALALLSGLALFAGACAPATSAPPTAAPATAAPATAAAKPTAAPTSPAAVAPAAAPTSSASGSLVVYSARKEELMRPVVDAFKARYTAVNVTVKSGAPGELALLVQQERSSPRGDIFFTTDAAGLEMLRQDGLLDPYRSPNASRVPDEFKAADGTWTGVIGRSRNFMINTQLLAPERAPQSVFELTDPKWKDQLAMASIREGGVRLWLASLLIEKGEAGTKDYIAGLKANNLKVLANHTEVANAVARGEVAVGLLNHYYYVPKAKEGAPVALIYPDQAPDQMGTLVTPLAVGIVRGARNAESARLFVDFLLGADGQEPLTKQEQEFPLVVGVGLGAAAAPGVRPIDQIKRPRVEFSQLADAEKRAIELFTPDLGG